ACALATAIHAQEPGFDVTVTGGAEARFTGRALACTSTRPGDERTQVLLEQGGRYVFVSFASSDPAPGEISVTAGPSRASVSYGARMGGGPGTYTATAGTVRITSVTAERLAGAVAADALDRRDGSRVRIEATFTAERVGEMVFGRCNSAGPAQSDGRGPPPPPPPPTGTFTGELGTSQASTPLAGEASFCVQSVDGTEMMTLRLVDRSAGVIWVKKLLPRVAFTPLSRGPEVWLERSGGTGLRLSDGYVLILGVSATGVTGRVSARTSEAGPQEGGWNVAAAVHATPGDCRGWNPSSTGG
ncbi:MAG TPA: hypothetical protein VGB15_13130, partial [Longimicrobium sp.]